MSARWNVTILPFNGSIRDIAPGSISPPVSTGVTTVVVFSNRLISGVVGLGVPVDATLSCVGLGNGSLVAHTVTLQTQLIW